MNDNLIIKLLISNNRINSHYKQIIIKHNIEQYLTNRYIDSESIVETIYRIWKNIEIRPVCKYCGNYIRFVPGSGFRECCSVSCSKHLRKEIHIECNDNIIKQEYQETGPWNKTSDKFLREHGYKDYLENRYIDSYSITETIYRILNNIEEKPKCVMCGKPVRLISYAKGFDEVCSDPCMRKNEIKVEDISDEYIKKLSNTTVYKENFRGKPAIEQYLKSKFGDEYRTYQEAVYLIRSGLMHTPKCPICGKYLTYNSKLCDFTKFKYKYTKYCSYECGAMAKRIAWKDKLMQQTGYNITLDEHNNFVFHNVCKTHSEFTLTALMAHNRCMEDRIKYMNICPICNPERNPETSIECIIKNILIKHNINFEQHNRALISPKELDFYLPDYNIAIECNGMYWHSDIKVVDRYNTKYELCKNKNIILLTFWENDIIYQQDKIENIILSFTEKLYNILADQCIIKNVDTSTAKTFISKYQLQSYINSSIRLGLYYNDELVQLITLGKTRSCKKSNIIEYELHSICTKHGYNVIDGFNTLLLYFRKHYMFNIIKYNVSKDYVDIKIYKDYGFKNINVTYTDSFYYNRKTKKSISKYTYQKYKSKQEDLSVYIKCITNGIITFYLYNN